MSSAGEKFQRLVEIMARLRSSAGCPWDREQTFDTIKPYLLEETYEVLDAVDAQDWQALAEELGDLLLEVVFLAQIAAERELFHVGDSLDLIHAKLVRRHPHVFGTAKADTPGEVKRRWDQIKAEERERKGQGGAGLLAAVPRKLPALVEAAQVASRAAEVGFDWQNADQVLAKLDEELAELAEARQRAAPDEMESEIGDLLFVLVNLARFLKVDPEQALRRTNRRFRQRFGYLERKLAAQGKSLTEATLDEMEALWQQAKL
jgi:MazG family protein